MARKYAPALSVKQFKALRPKGNYDKYLGYLERNRPGWNRPQAATPQRVAPPMRGPLPNYESLLRSIQILNPNQMEAQANRMAGTQLKYQQQLLGSEYKQAQDDALRRMQAFAAAGRAAAGMNASLIGQVGGQYQAGADALNAMGAGLTGQMSGATDAAVGQANTELARVGAPEVAVGGAIGAPSIAGPTQAGVEMYRGATLPTQALANAGGYAQAGLAGQISSQNLRATQEAQAAYMTAMQDAGSNRQAAIKELVQGRPQMAMQYLQQLQDNQRQAIALASSLVGAGFEQGMTKKEYAQKVKQQGVQNTQWQMTFDEQKRQFDQSLSSKAAQNAVEMSTIDASASRAWGYLISKGGEPIKDKSGKLIPVKSYTGGSAGGKGGLTAYQLSRLMPKAQDATETMFYGYTEDDNGKRVPATSLGTFDPQDPNTWGTGGLDYGQAITRLTRMGVPKGTASQILSQYWERGDRGRPVFSDYETSQLKKRYGSKFGRLQGAIKTALSSGNYDEATRLINLALSGGKYNPPHAKPGAKPTSVAPRAWQALHPNLTGGY